MSQKIVYRALDIVDKLVSTRTETFSRGELTGFHTLDRIASFKVGSTTVVYSPPHVGKTIINLDILMSLAERGNFCVIYSPEFRKPEELFQSLIQAKLKIGFNGPLSNQITDELYLDACSFINEYFAIIQKPPRSKDGVNTNLTIPDIFNHVYAIEKTGVKVNYVFIDPFNYLGRTPSQKTMTDAEYVLDANDMLVEYSERMGLHTIISAHTRDMDLSEDKETGIKYYPVGHPSQIMGGQSWYRASYQILHFWRAPAGVIDKTTGVPYVNNHTIIFTQKAKPWGSGHIGDTRGGEYNGQLMDGLFFDVDRYVMYEVVDGVKYYRNEYYQRANIPTKVANFNKPKQLNLIEDIF